jgi:pilus assembly protein CpaF
MMNIQHVNFGSISEYLEDHLVTDIMCHSGEVWVDDLEKGHYLTKSSMSNNELLKISSQLAQNMKTNFNSVNPILDAETNELRINCIHESLSPNGIVLSIRKTPTVLRLTEEYLIESDYLTFPLLEILKKCIKSRLNIVIAGETGAGKTEFLKFLVQYINDYERIITIEDTLEARLKDIYPDKDIVSLKINHQYKHADLIRTAFRQRPDWILVSETRGEEINDLIDSIASGHSIITTLHAMSARDIPERMLTMMKSRDKQVDKELIYHYFDIGIYIRKIQDNGIKRRIVEVVEYIHENGKLKTRNLFEALEDECVMDCLSDVARKKMYHKAGSIYY